MIQGSESVYHQCAGSAASVAGSGPGPSDGPGRPVADAPFISLGEPLCRRSGYVNIKSSLCVKFSLGDLSTRARAKGYGTATDAAASAQMAGVLARAAGGDRRVTGPYSWLCTNSREDPRCRAPTGDSTQDTPALGPAEPLSYSHAHASEWAQPHTHSSAHPLLHRLSSLGRALMDCVGRPTR